MLSISEYYILKKKPKQRPHICWLLHCHIQELSIFLTTKIAPENKCLNTAEALTTLCSRKSVSRAPYQYFFTLMRGCKEAAWLLSGAQWAQTETHLVLSKQNTVFLPGCLNTREDCIERVVEYPGLEIFSPLLNTVLSNLFFLTLLEEGGLDNGLQWCLPTSTTAKLGCVSLVLMWRDKSPSSTHWQCSSQGVLLAFSTTRALCCLVLNFSKQSPGSEQWWCSPIALPVQ